MQGDIANDRAVFIFTLSVKLDAPAYPLTYRVGSCVNQSVDAVSISLDPGARSRRRALRLSSLVRAAGPCLTPHLCCERTGASGSIAQFVRAAYKSAIVDVTTFNGVGKVVPAKAVSTDYGIKITLPEVLFVDSFPTGDFYTFQVQLATSAWSDTSKFPCRKSGLEPGSASCDYYLHGWQTATGYPRNQLIDASGEEGASGARGACLCLPGARARAPSRGTLADGLRPCLAAGELIPGCCPEGVVKFSKQLLDGTCNARLSDTPWRVQFVSNSSDGASTALRLLLTPVAIGAQIGSPDCSTTGLDQVRVALEEPSPSGSPPGPAWDAVRQRAPPPLLLRGTLQVKLYLSAPAIAVLKGVYLNGKPVSYTSGKDPSAFLAVTVGLSQGLGSHQLALSFGYLGPGVTTLTDVNLGAYSVLSYVLNGKAATGAYQCCARGDLAIAGGLAPPVYG